MRCLVEGGDSYGQSKEKSTFRSIFHKPLAIHVKAMAWDKAWFNPFCNDYAIPGLWQR